MVLKMQFVRYDHHFINSGKQCLPYAQDVYVLECRYIY